MYVYLYYFLTIFKINVPTHFCDFLYITCMVLTWQVPEIEVCISEHSVFSIGQCLGVAMGSLETYTHVIPMPGLHLFLESQMLHIHSFLFSILFFSVYFP